MKTLAPQILNSYFHSIQLDPKASKIHDEFNITNPNMLNAQQVRFSKQANDKFTVATMPKQSRKVKMVPKTNKQTNKQKLNILLNQATKAYGIHVGPQYVRIW